MEDIEGLKKEYQELLQRLSDPELISNWDKFEELTKRKTVLEKIIEKGKELEKLKNKIEENREILKSKEDRELSSLAEAELIELQKKEGILQIELATSLKASLASGDPVPGSQENPRAIIVEIRAGAGGEEAGLFVADLFKMYSKYAQLQGWRQKLLDSSPTEVGGFKEIVFELKDGNVFLKMQCEAGVHRVQRIPSTEKSGRIHTSTATVAVLPEPKKTEIKMSSGDLKIDSYHSSGPGGQYVNKRMTAVRITHLPSGLVVTSQSERSLLQNKENALSILGARLLEKKQSEETEKIGGKRRAQIGGAKRAEKIRTYNFPQDRVTDHRIKKSFHDIEGIMEGKLEPIIKPFLQVP